MQHFFPAEDGCARRSRAEREYEVSHIHVLRQRGSGVEQPVVVAQHPVVEQRSRPKRSRGELEPDTRRRYTNSEKLKILTVYRLPPLERRLQWKKLEEKFGHTISFYTVKKWDYAKLKALEKTQLQQKANRPPTSYAAAYRVSGVTQYLPQDYQKHIDGFYQMLREKYHKHRPQCIICLDETSVSYAPSAKTTLTDVGAKHVPIRNVQDKVTCTALLIKAFNPLLAAGDRRTQTLASF
eukprot:PhM_4_TR16823/c2_g1_i1/m.47857